MSSREPQPFPSEAEAKAFLNARAELPAEEYAQQAGIPLEQVIKQRAERDAKVAAESDAFRAGIESGTLPP